MIGRGLQTAALLMGLAVSAGVSGAQMKDAPLADGARVTYHTTQVDGLKIFYREAGPKDAPAVVLLHGFPSSSHIVSRIDSSVERQISRSGSGLSGLRVQRRAVA